MTIRYETEGPMATITFDRPETKNAFTVEMQHQLQAAFYEADDDPAVIAIVLTGAGTAFSSGIDASVATAAAGDAEIAEAAATSGADARPAHDDRGMGPGFGGPFRFPLHIRKPVIAAVNGICAGGGLIYAAMADLRFMAEEASVVTVFSRRGLMAEHGLSWILPRLIGVSRALDLLWSSRRVDADEALRIGLADRVVRRADLLDECRAYVDLLASDASPWSMMQSKRLVYRSLAQDFGTSIAESDAAMGEALRGPDMREGFASFLERRPPQFDPLPPYRADAS